MVKPNAWKFLARTREPCKSFPAFHVPCWTTRRILDQRVLKSYEREGLKGSRHLRPNSRIVRHACLTRHRQGKHLKLRLHNSYVHQNDGRYLKHVAISMHAYLLRWLTYSSSLVQVLTLRHTKKVFAMLNFSLVLLFHFDLLASVCSFRLLVVQIMIEWCTLWLIGRSLMPCAKNESKCPQLRPRRVLSH